MDLRSVIDDEAGGGARVTLNHSARMNAVCPA